MGRQAYAEPLVIPSQCFKGYTKVNGKTSSSDIAIYLSPCIDALYGSQISGTTANSKIDYLQEQYITLQESPNSVKLKALLKGVSEKAQEVYYNNETCGADKAAGAVPCHKLGQISRTYMTGFYKFHIQCSQTSHPKCTEYGREIANIFKDICDKSVDGRLFCDKIIAGFLNSPACAPSQTLENCLSHVNARKNTQDCKFSTTINVKKCTGGGLAEVTEDDSTHDNNSENNSPVETSSVDPSDVTNQDVNDLTNKAEELAENAFGGPETSPSYDQVGTNNNYRESGNLGGSGFGGNGFSGSNSSGSSDINIQSGLRAEAAQGNPARPSQLAGQAQASLPLAAQLPLPTRGQPGGSKKGGGAAPTGAPPNIGGGGGGGAISGGVGNLGGGSKKRRRGRRRSKRTSPSDLGGHRYFGTSGSSSGGGTQQVLDKRIKKQIEKNKKINQLSNKARINAALQKGLGQSHSRSNPFFKPIFSFPVNEAYDQLSNSEKFFDQKGQLQH